MSINASNIEPFFSWEVLSVLKSHPKHWKNAANDAIEEKRASDESTRSEARIGANTKPSEEHLSLTGSGWNEIWKSWALVLTMPGRFNPAIPSSLAIPTNGSTFCCILLLFAIILFLGFKSYVVSNHLANYCLQCVCVELCGERNRKILLILISLICLIRRGNDLLFYWQQMRLNSFWWKQFKTFVNSYEKIVKDIWDLLQRDSQIGR